MEAELASSFTKLFTSALFTKADLMPITVIVILTVVLTYIFIRLFKPFSFQRHSSFFLSGNKSGQSNTGGTNNDLPSAIGRASSEEGKTNEKILLKGILNFGNIDVSAVMCPRIDVTALDIGESFDRIIPVIISSGFSRIPVYSESYDNIKGILYAKDILPYMTEQGDFNWQVLLREPYFVPETKKIYDLLKEFQTRKIHMAIVIDEFGGTSGIITLEDIIEEIVGEISDESDEDSDFYRKVDDNTYIFEGKTLLNDFYRIFGMENDPFGDVRGDSETLAGLILELTGEIPQKNKIIKLGDFTFRIESSDKRRIKEIRVEFGRNEDVRDKK